MPLNNNDQELFAILNNTKVYLDNNLISEDPLSFNDVVYVNINDLYLFILDFVHYNNEYSQEIVLKDANSFTEYNLASLVYVFQISFALRYDEIDACKELFKELKNFPIPTNYPYTKELIEALNQLESIITKVENKELLTFNEFTITLANLAIIYTSKDYDAYLENKYGFINQSATWVYPLYNDIDELATNLDKVKQDKANFENLKKLEIPKNLKHKEKIIIDNLNNIINNYNIVIPQLKNYNSYLNKDAKDFIVFENKLKKDLDNLYNNIKEYTNMFKSYYEFFQEYFMI